DGFRRVWRQRREYSAGVEPAHAFLAEQFFPVHFAGLDLRGGRVAAVRTTERRANAETLLGEVETDARVPAEAVELAPDDFRGVDTTLHHEIFDEPPEVVDRQRGDRRGA